MQSVVRARANNAALKSTTTTQDSDDAITDRSVTHERDGRLCTCTHGQLSLSLCAMQYIHWPFDRLTNGRTVQQHCHWPFNVVQSPGPQAHLPNTFDICLSASHRLSDCSISPHSPSPWPYRVMWRNKQALVRVIPAQHLTALANCVLLARIALKCAAYVLSALALSYTAAQMKKFDFMSQLKVHYRTSSSVDRHAGEQHWPCTGRVNTAGHSHSQWVAFNNVLMD